MRSKENADSVYVRNGYNDRDDYLAALADDRGVDPLVINMLAETLGESEDFDGLVSELDDLDYSGLLDDFRTGGDGSDSAETESER
jgi:hypothetical protein